MFAHQDSPLCIHAEIVALLGASYQGLEASVFLQACRPRSGKEGEEDVRDSGVPLYNGSVIVLQREEGSPVWLLLQQQDLYAELQKSRPPFLMSSQQACGTLLALARQAAQP